MTQKELRENVRSKSVRTLNPHIFTNTETSLPVTLPPKDEAGKSRKSVEERRIRQSLVPILNKLESGWFAVLQTRHPRVTIRQQSRRYKLCSGAWYKPDLTAIINGQETAWECKGPRNGKNVARGILTLKFAAHEWPEIQFWLVWKSEGQWHEQKMLP